MSGIPKKMDRHPIGQAIMEARIDAGLTQTELAKTVGVTLITVARWEKTGMIRGADKLEAIAKALKTSTSRILGVRDNEHYALKNGKLHKFVNSV